MPRWPPDARARLQEAAFALYDELGFDEATVAEITERAGLTKRTFFRYFADKREVLFWGAEHIDELFVTTVQAAPAAAGALDAVSLGLDAVAARSDEQGEANVRRYRIITASPELRERQLIKFTALAAAVARALRARGVGDPAAILAAEAGLTALRVASDGWIDETNEKPLRQLIAEVLAQLRAVASAKPSLIPAQPR